VNDYAAYLRKLRRGGYTVQLAGSGHYQIRDLRGRLVAVTSATPSDHRTLLNLKSQVRRARPQTNP
jgi:hypothetical protein